MNETLFTLAGRPVPAGEAAAAIAAVAAILLLLALIGVFLASRAGRRSGAEAAVRAQELEGQIGALLAAQSAMTGRMQAMAEMLGSRQADLGRTLAERLDGMSHRLNQSVGEATKNTHDNLKQLHERMAVLDAARQQVSDLTGQVTTLTNILGNKQSRGAFGQGRMEAIISDHLPNGAFTFQFTLKNKARPDCVVHLPNGAPPLVIDAKFPLEGYNAVKAAATPEALKSAQTQFRSDVIRHIKDIRERYLVPGETHDTAFMFVPSESVFAEIHERFDDVIQRAYRARVVVVSPSLLLLSIQVVQALLRDARLREQAHIIQDEVMKLMVDIERLDDRVRKLGQHFGMTQRDVEQVLISTEKVMKRGRSIEGIGLEDEAQDTIPQLLAGE